MKTIDDTFGCGGFYFEGDFIENSPTWEDLLGDDYDDDLDDFFDEDDDELNEAADAHGEKKQ